MTDDAIRLVVVDDRGLRWAVLADDVREIVHMKAWRGERPLDVADCWGDWLVPAERPEPPETRASESASTARALIVRTRLGERALKSPRISFQIAERSKVLLLPDLLAWGRGAKMVAGILFSDSDEPLIILNPDGFSIETDRRLEAGGEGLV
jgi:hypothetical protein